MDKQLQSSSFSPVHPAAAAGTSSAPTAWPHETLTRIKQSEQFLNSSPVRVSNNSSSSMFDDGSREIRNNTNPFLERVASSTKVTGQGSSAVSPRSKMTANCSDDDDDEEEEEEGEEEEEEEEGDNNRRRTGSLLQNSSKTTNSELLRCTSNARGSYQAGSKARSRLLDPLPERKSGFIGGKSGFLRSPDDMLSRQLHREDEDDDDDPFPSGGGGDDDEDYKKKEPRISLIVVLEWVVLGVLIAALICSLTVPVLKEKEALNLELWKWEVLVLVLISGRLVSGWGIRFVVFLIERNLMHGKRVLYFVYGLKKSVRNCVWLGLALLTWQFLFDRSVEKEANTEILHYVTRLLDCFLIGSLIWLVKTFIVKVLGSSFHVNAFFHRIQESLFNQYVIQTLSGPPVFEIQQQQQRQSMLLQEEKIMAEVVQRFQPPDVRANVSSLSPPQANTSNMSMNMKSGMIRASPVRGRTGLLRDGNDDDHDDDRGISVDHLQKLNQKNVSAWNMKKLMRIIRLGALDSSNVDDEDGNKEIRSEVEAKAAARKIFRNVARARRRYIYLEDLLRFMDVDEAVKTLNLIEGGSENQRISKPALRNWVVNAFRERRALSLTLHDTKTTVSKLHKMVKVLVSVIICLIWLVILNIASTQFLLFLTSQLVLLAFVFGSSCKNVFESIVFLFVVHPYDVGDRCEIDGVQMIVEEMNILTTVFLRHDNQKITYPNSILATKPIHNYYRSPDMGDSVEFCFHILTPPKKITQVRQRILSYIENKKDHWYPNSMTVLKDVEGLDRIRIAVWVQHRMNHHDMGERWLRRALLLEECVNIFRELDIDYRYIPWNINSIGSSLPSPTVVPSPAF